MSTLKIDLPELPYQEWNKERITLHLILQIIGKTRLKLTPRKNHWWYITSYPTAQGYTTGSIPCPDQISTIEIVLNVHEEEVQIHHSMGVTRKIPLFQGQTIATFYNRFMETLSRLNIHPNIIDKPYDMGVDTPFSEITEYHHYDKQYMQNVWKAMLWCSHVFKEFSGRYYGKTSPVQIYWHHMDLAITRFSGQKGPEMPKESRISDKDAYSHEVISFGFWVGDDNTPEPTFYSYTYPSPDGLENKKLTPDYAQWVDANGSPMATLSYHELLKEKEPRKVLLDFLESAYQAGATLRKWDIDGNVVPSLDRM
ncbi:DUF5996 family protein [Algivirga pacifica]|uniref:DUF5996 family protein n=1 Tax=Algivirga pacifica TaxID=1162670 RepID=A0ABP9DBA6_9BACT